MRKTTLKTGFSLLELVIAASLVTVVIMGIFAINNVLTSNNQDYAQRYSVKSTTQTTLNHILNNASEAIGSGTNIWNNNTSSYFPDVGIQYYMSGVGDANSFCFHQDIPFTIVGGYTIDNNPVNSTPTAPPYTSASTRWLCYTWYPNTSSPPASSVNAYEIFYCARNYTYNSAYQGAGNCPVATSTYLGTAYLLPAVSYSSTTGFNVTLQDCFNNAALSCFSQGASSDPVNNPQVTLSGNSFPAQVGVTQT